MTKHEDPRLLGRNLPEEPLTLRRADLRPGSFDATAMTVDATITTFADVRRRDGRGAYIERLDRAGLDTRQLVGAPVLDGHRNDSGRHTIGVVSAVRTEGNALIATIRLTQAEDVQSIITRIREGVLRGVSVGYRVSKWSEGTDPASGERIRTAVAWTINEVSVVPCRPIPEQPSGAIIWNRKSSPSRRPMTAPPCAGASALSLAPPASRPNGPINKLTPTPM